MELETAPEARVTGVTVARDRHGLYIAKAPKSLRIHQGGVPQNPPGFEGGMALRVTARMAPTGDQLLSARVFFEGARPEDVARVLESAGSCKVSLCLRHRTPSTRIPLDGTSTGSEGHQGKVARLVGPYGCRTGMWDVRGGPYGCRSRNAGCLGGPYGSRTRIQDALGSLWIQDWDVGCSGGSLWMQDRDAGCSGVPMGAGQGCGMLGGPYGSRTGMRDTRGSLWMQDTDAGRSGVPMDAGHRCGMLGCPYGCRTGMWDAWRVPMDVGHGCGMLGCPYGCRTGIDRKSVV